MPMKNPPHPGLSVRYDCLEPLGLSVTEAAQKLGVSRKQLSELVNCRSGISPEMAIRLTRRLGVVPRLVSPSIGLRFSAGNEEGWTDPRGADIGCCVISRPVPSSSQRTWRCRKSSRAVGHPPGHRLIKKRARFGESRPAIR